MHEDLSRSRETRGSSDRAFGLTFAVVLSIVALLPLYSGGPVRRWALALAAALLVVALARPALLAPLNRLWTAFGLLLHRIVSPVLLAAIFFLAVTPTGLLMRLLGKRPLRLAWEPEAESYWIRRESSPDGPSMQRQF